jgi:phosphatidylserine decarboxylase
MTVKVATHLAARVVRALPRTAISRAVGRLCEAPLPPTISRVLVRTYCAAWGVDMSDVQPRREPYASFDEFFTRALRKGRRPASAEPDDIVSPADGVLQARGRVEPGCRIVVKGMPYDLARLIGDEDDARAYLGGQFAVVYLSPRDYHRVHAPVDGDLVTIRSLPGDLHPVNRIGELSRRGVLVANRRVVTVLETAVHGRVTLVLVGAMVVGRITLVTGPERDVPLGTRAVVPPVPFRRADELGAFHLGSTTVIVTGPQSPAWHREPGLIRVGESLTRNG